MTTLRQKILIRAVCAYLKNYPDGEVFYDGASCDGYCLLEDIKIEFEIEEK
jgi:hypothetical protein